MKDIKYTICVVSVRTFLFHFITVPVMDPVPEFYLNTRPVPIKPVIKFRFQFRYVWQKVTVPTVSVTVPHFFHCT
jgi:hypothetical protein